MIEDGYSICFNEWALDTRIKNELPILLMISSLTAKTGVCFASNKYFAELFDCTEVSISQKINKLAKLGYIVIDYEKRGAEVKKRIIRLKKFLTDDLKSFYPTVKKVFKDNNNNIFKNTSIKNSSTNSKKFIPPTLDEIKEYAKEKNRSDLVEKFWDYYNTTEWVDSNGKKVANWKGKFVTWAGHTPPPKNDNYNYSSDIDAFVAQWERSRK